MNRTYPSDYTDDEIRNTINDFSKKIMDAKFDINAVMQLSPPIQLGQNELQKRILDRSAIETSRIQKLAIFIAVISIILALVAIYLSLQNSRFESEWKERQINLLESINEGESN